MINLNDDKYSVKESKVFNNGEAGVVEDFDIRIDRKTDEDHDRAPDYKLIFVKDGAEVNRGYYYQDDFDRAKNPEQAETRYVAEMKHLAESVLGKNAEYPQFNNYRELLDWTMETLSEKASKFKFRGVVDYGTTNYPNRFLSIKKFAPYMQNMKTENTLRFGGNQLKSPVQPDESAGDPNLAGFGSEDNNTKSDDLPF